MDKSQAEAIAQAVLAPASEEQELARQKRDREERFRVEKRKVAWLGLIGFVIGAAVAHYAGGRFVQGGLWGGVSGSALGWVWITWRTRRGAA